MRSSAQAFTHRGAKLIGVLGYPAANGRAKVPGVLFLHGFPGSEQNTDVRRALMERGVASFALHFSGAWGSEGRYRFSRLVDEARAGLRFLAARPGVDDGRLAVFGFSMGGWTAIHLGARVPGLRAVAAVAPVGGAEMVGPGLVKFVNEHSRVLRAGPAPALARDFAESVRRHDPAESAAKMRPPLLLVHGTDDEVVPFAVSERIYAAARGKTSFLRVPGAGHSFLDRRAWLARRAADWLAERL